MARLSVKQRLENHCHRIPEAGCWVWDGDSVTGGYGRINISGRNSLVHRVAYEEYIDAIPEGMLVLHKCDVPSCFNPDHLFLGSQQENMDDKMKKGRWRGRNVARSLIPYTPCAEGDCDRQVHAKGLCKRHWQRRDRALKRSNQRQ